MLEENDLERYASQLIMPEIEEEGQTILLKSKVLIIGAGGLGNPTAIYCSAAGIGSIDICDYDKIELSNEESLAIALEKINDIIVEPEKGVIYNGKVVKTVDFGAFVNFLGSKDGLVHISELQEERTNKTTDVCKEGDELNGR